MPPVVDISPQDAVFVDRPVVARLRILATTDLHVHVVPWDYLGDRPSPTVGLARTASLIAKARAEVACCLLLDNGDFLQGSPLGEVSALALPGPHPMIAVMNALGYDAATLGNHEFSHGLGFLMRQLRDAVFPVISANIAVQLGPTPLDDRTLLPPRTILARRLTDSQGGDHDLRIGVIGLAPPQTTQWEREHLQGEVVARDILEAAAAHVPQLRADGADIVIALSHSGIGQTEPYAGMENATAALAALSGIDILIAGHTHQTFPDADFPPAPAVDPIRGSLFGKPAVMPGFHGSHLGVIDLGLARHNDQWLVADSHAELRPIARRSDLGAMTAVTDSAREILAIADKAHRATRRRARRLIGQTAAPLHSYFAMVAACPAVRLVAQAQAAHVARALQGTGYASLPLVSAAAPFRAGGRGGPENYTHISRGPLVMRNVFDLCPHPNTIAALLVTGAELQLWLDRSFSQFRQIPPGAQDIPLVDPNFPSFNFDTLEPLTWEVDLTEPPRFGAQGAEINPASRRIRDLALRGIPVDPAARFVLATNSYRASGSGGFAGAAPERIVLSEPVLTRDILLGHLALPENLGPARPANWRFRAQPGTSVTFDSAPAAEIFAADLLPQLLDPLEITGTGFRRFRLHL